MGKRNAYNHTADMMKSRGVPWIIPGWLAAGEVHMLAGAAKTGKSQLAITLAAKMTSGQTFYDGTGLPVSRCAMYSNEEDALKVLKPRFDAAGGRTENMHLPVSDQDAGRDLDAVAAALTEPQFEGQPPIRLIVIDGVASAVENPNDATEVRRYLYGVKKIAERTRAAIMLITHCAKGAEGRYRKAQDFVLGTQAWVAVPRMSWVMVKDRSQSEPCALLVRFGNLPAKMDGALRIFGGDTVSTGKDEDGLPITASKITSVDFLQGDPDELFGVAAGIESAVSQKGDKETEAERLATTLIQVIGRECAKTESGYVKHSEILFGNYGGSESKTTKALAKLKKEGRIIQKGGLEGTKPATKWWCLAENTDPTGLGLDTKPKKSAFPAGFGSDAA